MNCANRNDYPIVFNKIFKDEAVTAYTDEGHEYEAPVLEKYTDNKRASD